MEKVILFGAGMKCNTILDFLNTKKLNSHIYALCDNNFEKIGNKLQDKPILSYEETKSLNLPYVVTTSEEYKDEICNVLDKDDMEYYRDVFRWLQIKLGLDATEMNREYCAFYHVDKMDVYFNEAESQDSLDMFWGENSQFKSMFDALKLDRVVELACGRGRHVEQYANKAKTIVLVDILEKNIEYCKRRFSNRDNIIYYKNNGYDLSKLNTGEYSALFTYDAMVHFEMFDVYQYLLETYRILRSGGKALFHHSNFAKMYDQTFNNAHNKGGRNFMSKELFAYLAYKAGFDIVEQKVIDWSEPEMDCITLVKKP